MVINCKCCLISHPKKLVKKKIGGNYPFVGKIYKMDIPISTLLSWLENTVANKLEWNYIILESNGNFSTLTHKNIFPMNGISLKWAYDEKKKYLYFYFYNGKKMINWRYDILIPKSDKTFKKWKAKGFVLCNYFNFTLTMVK